ncbi:MAG: outer membrane beta-barrel family protein [Roseburia sp.]|nr:outer membrane beta-barrel family protein [Roseburia sp.]
MLYLSTFGSVGTNSQLSFGAYVWSKNNSAKAYNPVRQQLSEVFGTMGNPALKNTTTYNLYGSYTWTPSRIFSMSMSVNYTFDRNFTDIRYLPLDGVMYAVDNTDGNRNLLNISLQAPIKLMGGRLNFMPNASMTHVHINGGTPLNLWSGNAGMSIYWYPADKWSINMSGYQLGLGKQFGGSGAWNEFRPALSLSAGANFTPGNWNIGLSVNNLTDNDSRNKRFIRSRYLCQDSYEIFGMSGISVQLSVTYTFDYGKRVNHGNETRVQGSTISNVR